MKFLKISLLIVVTVFTFVEVISQQEIFLKRIEFLLDARSDIEYENEQFITIKFNKGATYIFKVKNHIDDYAGEAVIELLDADNLIMTNSTTEKYYSAMAFQCQKTAFYDILIKFKDQKLGNSQIDILMRQ